MHPIKHIVGSKGEEKGQQRKKSSIWIRQTWLEYKTVHEMSQSWSAIDLKMPITMMNSSGWLSKVFYIIGRGQLRKTLHRTTQMSHRVRSAHLQPTWIIFLHLNDEQIWMPELIIFIKFKLMLRGITRNKT